MNPAYDTAYLQRTILAGIIDKPERAAHAFSIVKVDEFDYPARFVAQAMTSLRVRRQPITIPGLEDRMRAMKTLDLFGGMADLWALAPLLGPYLTNDDSFEYAVAAVAREVQARRLAQGARSSADTLDEQSDVDVIEVAEQLERTTASVKAHIEGALAEPYIPTLEEFLAEEDAEFDWVIPGLLERGDRMIVTGGEGLGKSTLLRQIAVCAAAGIDPFTLSPIPPKRALIVDCENKAIPSRRKLRPLRIAAAGLGLGIDPSPRLNIEVIDGGLELDRGEDEARLVNLVTAVAPDLLIVGPIYYLSSRDGNEEDTGRQVARVLDRCRTIANCAILTEGHMGHGMEGKRPLRPVGTSLWLRWPDLGYGIVPTEEHTKASPSVRMTPWRGDRSERDWPKRLVGGGRMPWTVPIEHGVSPDESTIDVPSPYKD